MTVTRKASGENKSKSCLSLEVLRNRGSAWKHDHGARRDAENIAYSTGNPAPAANKVYNIPPTPSSESSTVLEAILDGIWAVL